MGIPHTYHDGDPEDRAYVRDFWTWLEEQPQQAWLYYARNANWDRAENMFVDMIDPRPGRTGRREAVLYCLSSVPLHLSSCSSPMSRVDVSCGGVSEVPLRHVSREAAADACQSAPYLRG